MCALKGSEAKRKSNQTPCHPARSVRGAGGAEQPAPVRGDGPLSHSCILYYKMTVVVIAT